MVAPPPPVAVAVACAMRAGGCVRYAADGSRPSPPIALAVCGSEGVGSNERAYYTARSVTGATFCRLGEVECAACRAANRIVHATVADQENTSADATAGAKEVGVPSTRFTTPADSTPR
jgi:hypothetical protein